METITISCAYCNNLNQDIPYSEDVGTFICKHCGQENRIIETMHSEKISKNLK